MPPRRRALDAIPFRASSAVSFADASFTQSSDAIYVDNIQTLRRSWRWAAFSQFFYTFAQLLQMPDVLLSDVEDDLARGTSVHLPRIMARLLVTMSLDRKLTISNWQTGFRKQCMKRGGAYNPLGPEPVVPSQNSTPEPEKHVENLEEKVAVKPEVQNECSASLDTTETREQTLAPSVEQQTFVFGGCAEEKEEDTVKLGGVEQSEHQGSDEPPQQSRDWSEFSLTEKLKALHTLTEWQFDNPHRLRQQMKDDGDHGLWRIEPIGYDAKTNAYWLIGPDRLWIQRSLPKPPRPVKRKRNTPVVKRSKPKASSSKAADDDSESEPEAEPERSVSTKRTRTANGQPSRSQVKSEVSTSSGRGTRAAKLKANRMLDVQARELAEFQRQAALLSSPSRTGRGTRLTRTSTRSQVRLSPSKRAVLGTRTSARLRGPANDSGDEWQQVPEEWLKDERDRTPPSVRRTRSKGKARAEPEEKAEQFTVDVAGLDSDAVSELTELSDDQQDIDRTADKHGESPMRPTEPVTVAFEKPKAIIRASKVKKVTVTAKKVEEVEYLPPATEVPEGFVEWETICVTLPEWEAISERFANATHYLEKALYKALSQTIVPVVVTELRDIERKRKIEEAVVHRKRSSRIALKESEKEQARAEALRKAEEEDKLSRARRLETRAKREEAEREKREQAREQRRQEREARELKIANRNAPKETLSEKSSAQSTPAPSPQSRGLSANSVLIPISSQLFRNSTTNGVRSPDWILDCEICGKNGINIDDGLPMVSCGTCGKWQHITCHDNADRHKGLPKRNWTIQKFLCQRCSTTSSLGNSRQQRSSTQHQSTDGWTHPHGQKAIPHPSHTYTQSISDTRYPQQPVYDNRMAFGGQQYPAQSSTATMYSRAQSQHGGVAYPQYQSDQRVYSAHASHSAGGWQNGYSSMPDGQRYADHGSFNVARVNPPYANTAIIPSQSYIRDSQPYSRPHDVQGYQRIPEAQSYNRSHDAQSFNNSPQYNTPNGNWNHASNGHHGATGQRSASHLSAAESLAFMQETSQPLHSWQNSSYVQQPAANGGAHANPSPSSAPLHHSRSSLSLGHGTSYQFPAS
ncbi:hypothetical protein BDY19DRAFT_997962 [Irpex rosettiformis]|uniref:Uncharacterized protein n=1 Tax=Irpex rosettiformis TaxID=378272 RepID=A0ACB8TQ70_9APHY|nr:hypothetical protein BDY19DRAFT_997962 [Irpex rosettiformis]